LRWVIVSITRTSETRRYFLHCERLTRTGEVHVGFRRFLNAEFKENDRVADFKSEIRFLDSFYIHHIRLNERHSYRQPSTSPLEPTRTLSHSSVSTLKPTSVIFQRASYFTVSIRLLSMVTVVPRILVIWTMGRSGMSAGLSMSKARKACRRQLCESHGRSCCIGTRRCRYITIKHRGSRNRRQSSFVVQFRRVHFG